MSAELFLPRVAGRRGREALRPLEGWDIVTAGVARPAVTCVEHLTAVGAVVSPLAWQGTIAEQLRVVCNYRDGRDGGLSCAIAPPPLASTSKHATVGAAAVEPLTQAMSGLMAAHGLDGRRPRPLGIDVASEAAGVLAATGLLAAELARRRGSSTHLVETSTLQAAVLYLTHHIAMATCGDVWQPTVGGDSPGPPFATADGVSLELEVPSGGAWLAFWQDLGVDSSLSAAAWPAFTLRYNTARCSLPAAMHAAMSRCNVAEVAAVAAARNVAICRQRNYTQVLGSRDWEADHGALDRSPSSVAVPPPWLEHATMRGYWSASARPTSNAPLAGMRVIESTHGLPGPLAGQLLRMLGADVVRIEPPGGDPSRALRPLAGFVGAGFLAYNRGKTPVEIDYKRGGGQAAIADLVSDADVFLHNWLPGRAESLGLDATTLGARNPGLVHMWVSGWGGATDADDRVGIEYFVQSHCGLADGLTPIGASPAPARLILAGVMAGLLACEAVVAALCEREQTHRGRSLETSLFLGAMALQADILRNIAAGRESGRRGGRPLWDVLDTPLATGDGFLVVAAGDEPDRRRVLDVFGARAEANDSERCIIEALSRRSAAAWESTLLDAGIPCAVVREDLAALPADAAVASSLESAGGACWVPAAPWRFHG